MEKEKISAKEIAEIKEKAEAKRQMHRNIVNEIDRLVHDEKAEMSPERQLEIIKRGYSDEIRALLKAYNNKRTLCPEAQLYIYTHKQDYREAYAYMIENMRLCFEVEKKLLADVFCTKLRRYSPQAEIYIVQKVLAETDEIPPKRAFLNLFKEYSKNYKLSVDAETLMVREFLGRKHGLMIDELLNRVEKYFETHQVFSALAQREMVKAGYHPLIMAYIKKARKGLNDETAVNLLLERADRAEIEAYYERYVEL